MIKKIYNFIFILIALLAIFLAFLVAWSMGVFEGTKIVPEKIEKIDLAPIYQFDWSLGQPA